MLKDQDQETVETGLTEMQAPEPTPSAEPVTIQGLADDVTAKVTEVNQPAVALTAAEMQPFSKDTLEEAENENMARNFAWMMQQANKPEVKVYTPPAVPKAIAEATRLEMEAGRKRVEEFAALDAARPRQAPKVDPREGSSVAVFRPSDYTQPDLHKNAPQHLPTATYRTL